MTFFFLVIPFFLDVGQQRKGKEKLGQKQDTKKENKCFNWKRLEKKWKLKTKVSQLNELENKFGLENKKAVDECGEL